MGVFVVLLLVPVLIQHCVLESRDIDYQKKNLRALAFFFVWFTVLVMFRHETVGNDTRNYIAFFHNYQSLDWSLLKREKLEIGFSYYNKFITLITQDAKVFLAITAFLTCAMMYPTYKRMCLDPSLTIVLFCCISTFVMFFSGIRQMLAVGIGFVSYEFTRRRKLFLALLCTLLAMAFHTSAFMLLLMYPLYHAKITKKWLLVVVPVLAVVYIFNRELFSVLSLFIEQYTEYEGGLSKTGAYTMIILFVLLTVFSFVVPEESALDKETVGLRNFMLLALVIQMFAPLHVLAMRMNYYYIIFIPLLIPKIIEYRSERWDQVAVVGRHIMVVFFLVYFFISASGGALHVFPYHFFWENIS